MNNSFESFELSTELIFQRFLMDKERRKNFYNGLELADYIALKVMEKDCIDGKVDRETVEAINLFAGTDIDIDEKEEVIDMCKAWEEQKNEGRELGREEGRELGREEGREEGRIRQAKVTALKLQKKGHSIEDIAECVDFDEETVKKWLVS